MKPLISVVAPYYNNSETIESCINSVINQTTDEKIEIIIIDDASNDKVGLEKIKNKVIPCNRIINIIHLNENEGGAYARNVGIDESQGEFIAFIDSDDVWLENKIEIQISSYVENTILTSCSFKGESIDDAVVLPTKVKGVDEHCGEALFCNSKLIQTSTFFMSADVARTVKFNSNLRRHQDYDFLLRAEHLGINIIQSEDVLSFWSTKRTTEKKQFLKKNINSGFFIEWFEEYKKIYV